VVGHPHVGQAGGDQHGGHLLGVGEGGQHRAALRCGIPHQLAPTAGQAQQTGVVEHACRVQRDQLAEAVPGHRVRPYSQ
jgi:hypothetical protein